jgi:DNA repair exonuclease SbcCD nuclease subunit
VNRLRFVLFSDLHLDAPFAWAPPDVARRRRQALRDVLERIVALADEVDADALLCAGDLYEQERFTPDTAAFLRATLGGTHRPVVIAPGNHDWFGPTSLYTTVDWPGNVHVFGDSSLRALELASGLTLWGAAHRAPANTGGFLEGFATDRGGVHLGLFHGSERSSLPSEGHDKQPHAPFDAEHVERAGLHHALCGHFHRPRDGAWHTYPGNPEPLTFGEDGPRGAVVVDVADGGTVERSRRVVAVTAVHDLDVDLDGCASLQDVRERVAARVAGLEGIARLTLGGELAADVDLRPGADLTLGALPEGSQGLDALVVRTGRLSVAYGIEAIASEPTVRGQFVRDVLEAGLDADERRRVLVAGLRALDGRDDLEVA